MKYGDDLVRQVQSMMGPGNPAPRSTTVGNWQDPQATQIRERVLAQARDAAPGPLPGLAPDRLSGPGRPGHVGRTGASRVPLGRAGISPGD